MKQEPGNEAAFGIRVCAVSLVPRPPLSFSPLTVCKTGINYDVSDVRVERILNVGSLTSRMQPEANLLIARPLAA